MLTVVFEDPSGTRRDVQATSGATLMQTAVRSGVPGIVAECGGALSCASCHVYVDSAWIEQTGRAVDNEDDLEDEMLNEALAERLPTSRLSCQIELTEDLDGLIVRIPAEQI
jgi:2Fe-2S ferredoxin